jgi:hypothetical protein
MNTETLVEKGKRNRKLVLIGLGIFVVLALTGKIRPEPEPEYKAPETTMSQEEIDAVHAAAMCDRWYFSRGQYLPPYRNPCPRMDCGPTRDQLCPWPSTAWRPPY